MHKIALGGNPHFFVLINGMSFVRVGVRTETIKHIFAQCVVLAAAFQCSRWWAKWRRRRKRTPSAVSIVWTASLRQEQAGLPSKSGR